MFKRIVVAVDPEAGHEAANRAAIETALTLLPVAGGLHLGSVIEADGAEFFPHVPEEDMVSREGEVRDRLDILARKYVPPTINPEFHVACGASGPTLVGFTAAVNADLLIVTSYREGGRWLFRRHTVEHVSVHAECAVLVLRVPGEKGGERESGFAGTPSV